MNYRFKGTKMKFIVDKVPEKEQNCPFSCWKPYPPFIEKTGDWFCKLSETRCDLEKDKCKWMTEKE